MSLRIKKGDTVKVIVGRDKGQSGKVIAVDPENELIKVENLNMVSRHHKGRSAQEQSDIIKMEGNINISNVMLVCPSCGKTTRIAAVEVDGKKHRSCKKCGFDIDAAKKAEKKPEGKKRATKTSTAEKTEKSSSRVKRTRKSDASKTE